MLQPVWSARWCVWVASCVSLLPFRCILCSSDSKQVAYHVPLLPSPKAMQSITLDGKPRASHHVSVLPPGCMSVSAMLPPPPPPPPPPPTMLVPEKGNRNAVPHLRPGMEVATGARAPQPPHHHHHHHHHYTTTTTTHHARARKGKS